MSTRMMIVNPRSGPAAALAAVALLAVVAGVAGPATAAPRATGDAGGAEAYAGEESEQLPVDVVVRVVNGTTRADGKAESVSLLELGPARQTVASAGDVTGQVVLQRLYLDETRSYVVQAVSGGTPYYTQTTGHDLAAGPVTVYVFETTTDRAGLSVSELNLSVRRAETELRLEYLITILNESQPQRTVMPAPTSFELQLPEDVVGTAFEVLSGAAPQKVGAVAGQDEERVGLTVPLRSGTTRLRVTASLPYKGRAHLRLAASLPIRRLTLLATPPDLRVDGEFSDAGADQETGCERWEGPALEADRSLRWTVSGGSAPRVAARDKAGAAAARPQGPLARVTDSGLGAAAWIIILAVVAAVVLALVAWLRPGRKPPAGGAARGRRRGRRGDA